MGAMVVTTVIDMSRLWEPPESQPYPAPTVTSRDGVMEPAPRAVTSLVMDMSDAGWTVMVQYAHGNMPHSITGKPLAAQPSWAVRAYRGTWHAVAVYRGKAWDTLYGWTDHAPSPKTFPITRRSTITEFRRWALADETGHIAR